MRENGGGTLVLHNLCRLLNDYGQDARILYCKNVHNECKRSVFIRDCLLYNIKVSVKYFLEGLLGSEKFRGYFDSPFRKTRRKFFPFVSKETIVVYSEGMFGNPLHAGKVIRWLLLYNSIYKKHDNITIGYDINDLFFTYRKVFNDPVLNPECKILYTPYYDMNLYKRYNYSKRNGKCYIIRKGKWRVNENDCKDGIIIDDLSEREKVRVFNECEYCISYDTQTIYTQIAALCGCITVIVPESGKGRSDYRKKDDAFYGEAFGFNTEEIEYALSTAPLIEKQWRSENEESKRQVKDFIGVCEKYFNNERRN